MTGTVRKYVQLGSLLATGLLTHCGGSDVDVPPPTAVPPGTEVCATDTASENRPVVDEKPSGSKDYTKPCSQELQELVDVTAGFLRFFQPIVEERMALLIRGNEPQCDVWPDPRTVLENILSRALPIRCYDGRARKDTWRGGYVISDQQIIINTATYPNYSPHNFIDEISESIEALREFGVLDGSEVIAIPDEGEALDHFRQLGRHVVDMGTVLVHEFSHYTFHIVGAPHRHEQFPSFDPIFAYGCAAEVVLEDSFDVRSAVRDLARRWGGSGRNYCREDYSLP